MEIKYALNEADILALSRHRLQNMPTLHRRMQIRHFGYPIGFTLMAFGLWLLYRDSILLIILLGSAIISFLFFPIYYDWRLRRSVSQKYQDAKVRATLAERTLRATNEGLEEISDLGESKSNWNTIDGVTITPTYTFMSAIGVGYSLVIPRNQVRVGNYDEFVNACRDYIQKSSA